MAASAAAAEVACPQTLEEDEAFHAAYHGELQAFLATSGGRNQLELRGEGGVGLLNQGGTCYMNSLLQALFHTPEFRQALFGWRYSEETHGDAASCIPFQLQRIFAQLQLSRANAISTRPLTSAFGFSGADASQQHDVQELCRVLFDALSRSSKVFETEINRLYSGKIVNYIRGKDEAAVCEGKVPESKRDEEFLDLQVPIIDCKTLEEALGKLIEPEVLEGGNQWFCEELGKKVDALKGTSFEKLPSIFCLQLLRFVFDYATLQRKKLTEDLSVPIEIDFGTLLGLGQPAKYELVAVCMHSGSTHAGHYRAFIRDAYGDHRWRDANDARVSVFSAERANDLFPRRGSDGPCALSSKEAYFLIYRRPDIGSAAAPLDSEVPEPHRTELLAENERLDRLQSAYRVYQQLFAISVKSPDVACRALRSEAERLLGAMVSPAVADESATDGVVVHAHEARPTMDVLRRVVNAYSEDGKWTGQDLDGVLPGDDLGPRARLRKYNVKTGEPQAPVSTEKGVKVGDELVRSPNHATSLLLEVREPGAAWDEWDEDGVRVVVCRWDSAAGQLALDDKSLRQLRLPPAAAKTPEAPASAATSSPAKSLDVKNVSVNNIRAAAATLFGASGDISAVGLVPLAGGADDVHGTLLADGLNVAEGTILCAAIGAVPQDEVRAFYERLMNTVHLSFNHPDRPEFQEEFKVSSSKDATLGQLKGSMAEVLGLSPSSLHICKGRKEKQFRDETLTLKAAGVAFASQVFVGHGAPRGLDEIGLRVSLYRLDEKGGAPKVREAFALDAKKQATVRDLRALLAEPLSQWLRGAGGAEGERLEPLRWQRIRLRDGQAGRQFKLLRDHQALQAALAPLMDGRQVAAEVLEEDEELAAEDLVVNVRVWAVHEGKLHPAVEHIVRAGATLQEVRASLSACFLPTASPAVPEPKPDWAVAEDVLEVLSVPSAGPPLTSQRCAGMEWVPRSRLSGAREEDLEQPAAQQEGIRDGGTLVVRSSRSAAKGPPAAPAKGEGKGGKPGKSQPGKGPSAGGKGPAFLTDAPPSVGKGERAMVIKVVHPEAD